MASVAPKKVGYRRDLISLDARSVSVGRPCLGLGHGRALKGFIAKEPLVYDVKPVFKEFRLPRRRW